jgi:flagellar biosynthesis/type III secretory pathway chaperone
MPQYKIAYGGSIIDGGLFLRRQTPPSLMPEYKDGTGGSFKHLSTFSGKSTIKESLVELLNSAQTYVFFTSFLIQDGQIIQSLIDAARRLRGHVYVLTTLKDNDFDALLENEIDDDQWNFKEHIECVRQLVRNGISVKARKDCHAKFAVIDDKYAVVTSANAVPTCFTDIQQKNGRLREANPENGVLIEIPSEVKRLSNFFRAIWRSAYNYELPPDAQISDIAEFSKEIMPITCREPASVSDEGRIVWTAPGDCRILNSIAKMIDTARQKITICSYVIKGIEKHLLGCKLLEAAKRGVEIEILLRGMYRRDHLDSCYFLKKALKEQINIHGDFCNHSKAVLIDDKEAMIMSANIDSQHGLDSSVEMGFLSQQPDFINSVANFINRLRAGCCLEFIANPKQKHAAEQFSTLSKPILTGNFSITIGQRWKDRDQIVKKMISEMNNQLIRVANPEEERNHKVRLLTNTIIVDCAHNGDSRLQVLRISETAAAANARFQQILPETTIEVNVS